MSARGGDRRDRSTTRWNLSACPPFDFRLQCSVVAKHAFLQNPSAAQPIGRPARNQCYETNFTGRNNALQSFDLPCCSESGDPANARETTRGVVAGRSGGKRVTRLEKKRAPITCGQQGAKRHRDKNVVPTPRQVVTHCIGSLSIADIAVQHRAGNRWQWHRQKRNGSATVRIEAGEAQRPL
jgi:hypothetical protein